MRVMLAFRRYAVDIAKRAIFVVTYEKSREFKIKI